MSATPRGLLMLVATAEKERSDVTIEEVRNAVVGWVEIASRLGHATPRERYADSYAVAMACLMAFCVEFAEPLASMPEAKVDWRVPIRTLAKMVPS